MSTWDDLHVDGLAISKLWKLSLWSVLQAKRIIMKAEVGRDSLGLSWYTQVGMSPCQLALNPYIFLIPIYFLQHYHFNPYVCY